MCAITHDALGNSIPCAVLKSRYYERDMYWYNNCKGLTFLANFFILKIFTSATVFTYSQTSLAISLAVQYSSKVTLFCEFSMLQIK